MLHTGNEVIQNVSGDDAQSSEMSFLQTPSGCRDGQHESQGHHKREPDVEFSSDSLLIDWDIFVL